MLNRLAGCQNIAIDIPMYYNTKISRNHSTRFYYQSGTNNKQLKTLSQTIWESFGFEIQTLIDGKSNNKGIPGEYYVELIVIQLFYNWRMDRSLCLASPKNNNALKAKDFYNPNQIAIPKLAKTFNALIKFDYVDSINHSHSSDPSSTNTTSRIRTSQKLNSLFLRLDATEFDVDLHKNELMIELRDGEVDAFGEPKRTVSRKRISMRRPYNPKAPHIAEMLVVLKNYNELLSRTHIDIASLDQPYVVRERRDSFNRIVKQLIPVNQNNKFVRRVFSRGSWKHNGRFYGPFWQQVGDKDENKYRSNIRINGKSTMELYYSGLYPNILTVEQGLKPIGDVYNLDTQIIPKFDMKQQRSILKLLVFVLLNASDRSSGFYAIRDKLKDADDGSLRSLTNQDYEAYLSAFIAKHPHLENSIASDQGSRLMHIDSQIIEHIIKKATAKEIAVLSLHDSVIVAEQHELFMIQAMKDATKDIVGTELPFDQNGNTTVYTQNLAIFRDGNYTFDLVQPSISTLPSPVTTRHEADLSKFRQYLNSNKL